MNVNNFLLAKYSELDFVAGELDHIPEVAFYMVGGIEEVIAKAERLAAEQRWM